MDFKQFKYSDKGYPSKLRQLAQPPKKVYATPAFTELLNGPCVAIVGSRKVTNYGRAVTDKLARELAASGITIISGLALGVDSIAHSGAVEVGGQTIAVLPTAFNHIYPAAHRGLARQIANSHGALISEYDDDSFVGKINFIARNRIIAALADAVIITEAAQKSGSLHTARFALELGREVMAVPGNITSPMSEGCNNLIKQGAIPITSTEDVMFALKLELSDRKPKKIVGVSNTERIILELLDSGEHDGVELLEKSKLTVSDFNQAMTMLELNGVVRSLGANHWTADNLRV
jgi:DNA processing protein